jgi:FAD/FMN-containing dehydrogenase
MRAPAAKALAAIASLSHLTVAVPLDSPFASREALTDCLTASSVPLDTLGSTDWQLDVAPYNLQLNYTPVGIAVPTTIKHIQDAVMCAAKLGLKANAKCGGHSYASFGLGGEDGHLTIELDRMNAVVLDNVTGVADIQGGARLGHVASELIAQGGRDFSHGTCPG